MEIQYGVGRPIEARFVSFVVVVVVVVVLRIMRCQKSERDDRVPRLRQLHLRPSVALIETTFGGAP